MIYAGSSPSGSPIPTSIGSPCVLARLDPRIPRPSRGRGINHLVKAAPNSRSVTGHVARAALVPPAAFAVHQLRFLLAFGHAAGAELGKTGHSYLHSVVPWIVALLGLATGLFLRAFGQAVGGKRRFTRTRTASFLTLWAACTFALVVIYAVQELIEGAVLVGHLPGLAGVFAFGGWWAVPAATSVGLVLAAAYYGVDAVLNEVTRRASARLPVPAATAYSARPRPRRAGPRPAPMAVGWSLRGPPGLR